MGRRRVKRRCQMLIGSRNKRRRCLRQARKGGLCGQHERAENLAHALWRKEAEAARRRGLRVFTGLAFRTGEFHVVSLVGSRAVGGGG